MAECGREKLLGEPGCKADQTRNDRFVLETGTFACRACISGIFAQEKSKRIKAEKLANTDPRTDLLNPRGLKRVFDMFLGNGYKPGIIQFDLVNFKKVNDTWSHEKGNEVLNVFSNVMKLNRETDITFSSRLGGDEFGLLMDTTPRQSQDATASEVLHKTGVHYSTEFTQANEIIMLNSQMKHLEGKPELGIRFGISVYSEGSDLDSMLYQSDPKLFTAYNTALKPD